MQRRNETQRLGRIWVERIAWNAAAAAALLVMVVLLLLSLQWLDQIDPEAQRERAATRNGSAFGLDRSTEARSTRLVRVDRPSG
jgi:hypothetical protein